MTILAIESSCDDSGIAILEYDNKDGQPKVLANLVSSQIKVHAKWGGVVPMLAKREHQRNLAPLLLKGLQKAKLLKILNPKSEIPNKSKIQNHKIKNVKEILQREPDLEKKLLPFLKKYQKPNIDYIAVTSGPGLEPALWVGVNLAKALSFFWDLPILPINHIEGHIAANSADGGISGMTNDQFPRLARLDLPSTARLAFARAKRAISNESQKIKTKNQKLFLPAMCLVVSGGHTQLILIKKFGEYEIIGETRDDAAGEAFDKVAKMLNLGYPGGPAIAQLAALWNDQFPTTNFQKNLKSKNQNNHSITQPLDHSITTPFSFPRPMMNSSDFDFSFSGLKTAVLYTLQKMTKAQIKKSTPAIAAAFEQAVIDVLTKKTINSAKKYEAKSIWLAGGVAANQALRQSLEQTARENNLSFLVPPNAYCADNAGMIALAAFYQLKQNRAKKISWQELKAEPNLRIS